MENSSLESATGQQHPSSFRDPHGAIIVRNGEIYRQVNKSFQENYDLLMSSGLYTKLVNSNLLIPHDELNENHDSVSYYKLLKPQRIPFISYPYEWSFSQLKNAALTTLEIQRLALEHGLSLRDSSAYNVQFVQGRPVLIDTLSFEKYREGQPWVAYRQFCQHFLAPLTLMMYKDIRLSQLFRVHIDGIPLDLASSLLPIRTRLLPSLLWHIHLHARSQRYFSGSSAKVNSDKFRFPREAFLALINNLAKSVKGLSWHPQDTEWAHYYEDTNYSPAGFDHKRALVGEYLDRVKPQTVWDLGANVGVFSRIASQRKIFTIAFDADPAAVELNYQKCAYSGEGWLLPLVLDLSNPSPSLGWETAERQSLMQRGSADVLLGLALVHHLCISNNVPLTHVARFFASLGRNIIIEFVPKTDSQVQRLLASREDVFSNYNQHRFEEAFCAHFDILASQRLRDSERTMYLMRRTLSNE
jgi:ribosomal protein L11 methylase PrmA